MHISPTTYIIDIDRLKSDTDWIVKKYDEQLRRKSQIGFTNSVECDDPFETVGSLYRNEYHRDNGHTESSFPIFNSLFEGTIFEEIYDNSPIDIGRMRLHLLQPKSCYSVHYDDGPRYHFSVHTNEHSYIWFTDGEFHHIPDDGTMYQMDAKRAHTAFNGGWTDRIHLVITSINTNEIATNNTSG